MRGSILHVSIVQTFRKSVIETSASATVASPEGV